MDTNKAVPVPVTLTMAPAEGRAQSVVDHASLALMAQINALRVSLEDIHLASAEIHKLLPAERTRQGRTRCLARAFHGQRRKAFVLNARLEALARLVRAGQIPCWVLPAGPDGVQMIADPVFQAAAQVPLIFIAKEAQFEPVAFVACVLEHATVYGHA